jgi:hypothetical protein
MRPESDVIEALSDVQETFSLRTWGGKYQIEKRPQGGIVGFGIRQAIKGVFHGRDNDTVVEVESALGAGTREKVQTCTHFEYFLQPDVQKEIRSLRWRVLSLARETTPIG